MKLTRNPVGAWFSTMPRERRASWIFLTVLMAMFGAILLYQRIEIGTTPPALPQDRALSLGNEQSGAPPASEDLGKPVQANGTAVPAPPSQTAARQPWVYPLSGVPKVVKAFSSIEEGPGIMQYFQAVAYAADPGQPVVAANQGVVIEVEPSSPEGGVVKISHEDGMVTSYGPLGAISVSPGATVQSGQSIGVIGDPGPSQSRLGPHLEFKVLYNGQPVDPATYLPK